MGFFFKVEKFRYRKFRNNCYLRETVLIFFVDFNVNNVESQCKNMARNRTRLALTTRYVLIDLITNRFIGCEQCTIIRECMFFFANPKDFACHDFG